MRISECGVKECTGYWILDAGCWMLDQGILSVLIFLPHAKPPRRKEIHEKTTRQRFIKSNIQISTSHPVSQS